MLDFNLMMMLVILFFLCILNLSGGIKPIVPENIAQRLLDVKENELVLIITGDPQYYFPCEIGNTECRNKSNECRKNNGLNLVYTKN